MSNTNEQIVMGTRKECCKVPSNLVRTHQSSTQYTDTCQVCGCKHRRMKVDPIKIHGQMTSLGNKTLG